MEVILLKNQIYTKVEKLTTEQLLLVSDFVGWVEKALPKKNTTVPKSITPPPVNGHRDMTAIYALQELFQDINSDLLITDVTNEREDRV